MLLWIIPALLSLRPQDHSLSYVPDTQLDGKNYTRNRQGVWEQWLYCTSFDDTLGSVWLPKPKYTVEKALEICAINCDASKNCFFANLKHDNGFRCTLLGDCTQTLSTNIAIYSENGMALYKKGLYYEPAWTGVWAVDFYCQSEAEEFLYFGKDKALSKDEALEACAIRCDKLTDCSHANLVHDNFFQCYTMNGCIKKVSSYTGNQYWNTYDWLAMYEKDIWIPDLLCTFGISTITTIPVSSIERCHLTNCASACDESKWCFNTDPQCTILGDSTNLFTNISNITDSTRLKALYVKGNSSTTDD